MVKAFCVFSFTLVDPMFDLFQSVIDQRFAVNVPVVYSFREHAIWTSQLLTSDSFNWFTYQNPRKDPDMYDLCIACASHSYRTYHGT